MATKRSVVGLIALLTLGLAACGGGTEDVTTETESPAPVEGEGAEETPAATGETVQITGVDYAFEGVPDSVEAGTELSFTNASEAEFHEMVVMRIDDDEVRTVEELLQLPEEESETLIEFVGVQVAPPGEDGISPPDAPPGPVVLEEAGRYALLCFIPTGADPEALVQALEEGEEGEGGEGPPEVEGGPPHFTEGMAAEITVSG
ncbi:MAG: hypothetical protein ACR2NA_05070 [Solirubrobacterales bacterium]